ncbi:MAG: nucleotide-binding protein, partial [Ilumatobacteraceae bacterium]
MKLAIAGKGGAGKTTFTASASRLIARTGIDVVAIDADSNPNL